MKKQGQADTGRYRRALLLIVTSWSMVVGGLLSWTVLRERANTRELAQVQARATFARDQAFRHWVTSHGGVYVVTNVTAPPNPHLADYPNRDIVRPDGTRLTLMNPAYALREMNGQFARKETILTHITSLRPLRPGNAPDDWERAALQAFEQGVPEVNEFTQLDGKPFLRLMQPTTTEKPCLTCHAQQGYQEGDIRGGIAVSLPMAPLLARERRQVRGVATAFGIVWFVGLVAAAWAVRAAWRRAQRQHEIEEAQAATERQLRSILQTAPNAILTVDHDGRVHFINRSESDAEADETANIRDFVPEEHHATICQAIDRVYLTGEVESVEHTFRNDGAPGTTWHISRIGPMIEEDKVTAVTIVSTNITKRKEREDALRNSMREVEEFNRLAMGRELRMIELKTQVNALLIERGGEPEYSVDLQEERGPVDVAAISEIESLSERA